MVSVSLSPQGESTIHTLREQRDRARRRAVACYLLFMPCATYTLTHFALLWVPATQISPFAQIVFDQPLLWSAMAALSVLTLAGGILQSMRAERLEFYKDPQHTHAMRALRQSPHLHAIMLRIMRQQSGIFEFQIRKLQWLNRKESFQDLAINPDTRPGT